MHDDVGQRQLPRFERPVAAEAGVNVNDQTMAVPARGATLQTNVSEAALAASSAAAVRTNLPQINYLVERDVRRFVAAPLAAIS